jgi:hypothetical protein
MSDLALIQFAEPLRTALPGNSMFAVLLAMMALLLLLALGALIATARILLEPIFVLIGTLLRLLLVIGAAVAIIVMVVSGSAHAAPGSDAGVARPPAGVLP